MQFNILTVMVLTKGQIISKNEQENEKNRQKTIIMKNRNKSQSIKGQKFELFVTLEEKKLLMIQKKWCSIL